MSQCGDSISVPELSDLDSAQAPSRVEPPKAEITETVSALMKSCEERVKCAEEKLQAEHVAE